MPDAASNKQPYTPPTPEQRADRLNAHYARIAERERAGEGFYLSCETPARAPAEATVPDEPVVSERILFNWHNFLSGCSTWDLPQWKQWIDRAANLRFNTVMIHCYGNNPALQFALNGQTKPVEYLSTTARGRDWSTQHVRDVRTMPGADELFAGPVFGAQAGMVEAEQCHAAARDMMHGAFEHAATLGMGVNFSWDINTLQANPQALVRTLPDEALLQLGAYVVPNPDHAEGYTFYRAQIEAILRDYPQVTDLTPWFRVGTGFGGLYGYASLNCWPEHARDTVRNALAQHPALVGNLEAPGLYLTARVIAALQRAAAELGRADIRFWTGSWQLEWIEPAHALFPRNVGMIPLDYNIVFDQPVFTETIAKVSRERAVVPVLWPNHDDFTYFGRCYQPPAMFASKLERMGAVGFGVIHWTTRPLDLHVTSLSRQTWRSTRDEPVDVTTRKLARDLVGPVQADAFATYLADWLQTAPMVGRETSDWLFDQPVKDIETIEADAARRTGLLNAIDTAALDEQAKGHIHYFVHFERFITGLCRTQADFDTLKAGEAPDPAKVAALAPHAVNETFGRMIRHNGPNRGELGQLVSLNTRWLPYLIDMKQQAGVEPIRLAFGPTQHDTCSGLPGRFTWLYDEDKQLWRVLGQYESLPISAMKQGGREWIADNLFDEPRIHTLPAKAGARQGGITEITLDPPASTQWSSVFAAGIESRWPLAVQLWSILQGEVRWPAAGVTLLVPENANFNVVLRDHEGVIVATQSVESRPPATLRIDLDQPAVLAQVECHPTTGPARISGLIVHPANAG